MFYFNWYADEIDIESLEKCGLTIERKSKNNIYFLIPK